MLAFILGLPRTTEKLVLTCTATNVGLTARAARSESDPCGRLSNDEANILEYHRMIRALHYNLHPMTTAMMPSRSPQVIVSTRLKEYT